MEETGQGTEETGQGMDETGQAIPPDEGCDILLYGVLVTLAWQYGGVGV